MTSIDDKRIIALIDALGKNGWKKVGFSDQVIEWYFAEIIEFVSIWRPQGKKLFMVLLIDKFDYPIKNIIEIGFSLLPNNLSETIFETIFLKDILKADLKKFCEQLNNKVLHN
ncbi:hypothetical protein [Flavobacterium collinsii]|uniref:Uncharacterized protein n=1 Tax=Flavobacterium collinsii TaxID=1114861 RepID=A0ABN7EQS4_9FLAO|nr:hypothetical protein [Flavobacterium collinsii]GIQ57242.1 hypothetical protein Flavo103_03780 [Flavobacterium collinsii]CAA9201894.1 hypothetical protein FLACOL7796_03996 [Flavobacterium collinsii]